MDFKEKYNRENFIKFLEKDFLPEIDTKNLISNVQDATIVMPEKVANKFVTASRGSSFPASR